MSNTGNAGKGRPAGSKNKSLAIRTRAIREAISVEECQALARDMYRQAFDDTISPADQIKARTLLLKYIAHSADVELIADAESRAVSPEAMMKAAMLIEQLSK